MIDENKQSLDEDIEKKIFLSSELGGMIELYSCLLTIEYSKKKAGIHYDAERINSLRCALDVALTAVKQIFNEEYIYIYTDEMSGIINTDKNDWLYCIPGN